MGYQTIRVVTEKEGYSITVKNPRFIPLTLHDLTNAELGKGFKARLNVKDSEIIESTHPEATAGQVANMDFRLESHLTSKAVALIPGGWLPSGLAGMSNPILFPDLCTIKDICSIFENGEQKDAATQQDFLDLLLHPGIRINPSLYGMEGKFKQQPTPEQVATLMDEAITKIAKAFPKAVIFPNARDCIQGTINLLAEGADAMARKTALLLQMAPVLRHNIAVDLRNSVTNAILLAADAHGVNRHDLLVLAMMSCVAAPNNTTPARKVLKLREDYTEQLAYNALCDLRALGLYIKAQAAFPDLNLVFLTSDLPLAKFWSALQPHAFSSNDNGDDTYRISLDALFPNPPPSMATYLQLEPASPASTPPI